MPNAHGSTTLFVRAHCYDADANGGALINVAKAWSAALVADVNAGESGDPCYASADRQHGSIAGGTVPSADRQHDLAGCACDAAAGCTADVSAHTSIGHGDNAFAETSARESWSNKREEDSSRRVL